MVYIDDFEAPYRGMKMCHMIADSTKELLEMCDKIGVNRKWIQDKGTYQEHFDICLSKKKLAIEFGAREVTARELASMTMRRPGSPFADWYDEDGNLKDREGRAQSRESQGKLF